MFEALPSPYLVPFDSSYRVDDAPTGPPPDAPDKKKCRKRRQKHLEDMQELQRMLYAHDHFSVLLVFQAMDAAGKDSTIRTVMSGVNPAGCQVFSFKKPSSLELDHDFLWRTAKRLPERGRIGIFNRSYYEEVLVVRVHPEFLNYQRLPRVVGLDDLWEERYKSIREHEEHLARNGTVILKFFLNVSLDEQRARFLSRLEEPHKNWKFNAGDLDERERWGDYMKAYEAALNATSRPYAPWFSIPADDKPFMRMEVARIIVETLESLGLAYPEVSPDMKAQFDEMKKRLEQS